jgi:integrase
MWLLRLAVYTGARINEIAQLRRDNVRVEAGVPLIEFCEGHSQQSIKTGEARKVPLHPAIGDFLAYAKAAKGEFIFGAFPHDKNNGRAATLISTFGKFLRETCEIADTNLTLHSMRKRFADACIVAGLSAVSSRVLIGHAGDDVHAKVYETGPGLRLLAQDVAKLDPLGAD